MTPTGCSACDKRIAEAAANEPERADTSWQCPKCGTRVVLIDQRTHPKPGSPP